MLEESGLRACHVSAIVENYTKLLVDARAAVEELSIPSFPYYR